MEPPISPSPFPEDKEEITTPKQLNSMAFERTRLSQSRSLSRLATRQAQDKLAEGQEQRQKEADQYREYKSTPWLMSGTYDPGRGVLNGANNLAVSVHDFAFHAMLGLPPAKSHNWGLNAFGEQDTILGPIIRDFTQFGLGFGKVKMAHSGLKRSGRVAAFLKKRGVKKGEQPWVLDSPVTVGSRAQKWTAIFLEGAFLGGMADFIAWDPRQPNLTGTILSSADKFGWDNKMPGFSDMVKAMSAVPIEDWEKDNMTLEKQFSYRFATMAEGVLMGGVINSVWKGLKFAWLQRAVKNATNRYMDATDLLENFDSELAKKYPDELKKVQAAVKTANKDFNKAYDAYALTGKEYKEGKHLLTKVYSNSSSWIGPNPSKTLGPDVARPKRTASDIHAEDAEFSVPLGPESPKFETIGQAGLTKANEAVKSVEAEIVGISKLNKKKYKNVLLRAGLSPKTTKKQYKKFLEDKLSKARGGALSAQSEIDMLDVKFPAANVSKLEAKLKKLKDSPEAGGNQAAEIKILEAQIADTLAGPVVRDVPLSGGTMGGDSLAILSDDGKVLAMDYAAIRNDWIENKGGALRGQRPDSTGKSTKANLEEIQIWNDIGVDPDKVIDEIISISKRMDTDPETQLELQVGMYEKFLELRLKWAHRLMKNADMDLEYLSPHFDSTNNIMMEAQHSALFSKTSEGGLGLNPNRIKADGVESVRSSHPDVTIDALKDRLLAKDEQGNPVALEKIMSTIAAVKKGTMNADDILDLFENGQLINFETMDMSKDMRSVMAGIATVWDDILKLEFPKKSDETSLARLYGWKGLKKSEVTARRHIENTILSDIDIIAKATNQEAAEVEHLFITGEAATFKQGQNLTNLKVGGKEIEDLKHSELLPVAAKVMAWRQNIHARLNIMHKWHDEMMKKTAGLTDLSKMTREDKMDLLTQLEPMFAEMHGVAEAGHHASQTMRALRDWKYLNRHNLPDVHGVKPLDEEEIAKVADLILESRLGGEEEIGRIMTVIQQVKADGKQLTSDAFEAGMREVTLMRNIQKRDAVGAAVEAGIIALLSGLDTQSVNLMSGVMMSFLHSFESYVGSYTPLWWKRRMGVVPKGFKSASSLKETALQDMERKNLAGKYANVTGRVTALQADQLFARHKALKNMMFQTRIMVDMARMMIRTSDAPHAVMTKSDLRFSQQQRAKTDVNTAAKSIVDSQQAQALGGDKFRELNRHGTEGYNSEAWGGIAKRTVYDIFGDNAYQWIRKQGKGPAAEQAAEMFDAIYRVAKTPLNFLVANDQALKYAILNADTHATLAAFAHIQLDMPQELIGDWVQRAGRGMIRENGSFFSEASLRAEALDIMDKVHPNRKWAEGEQTDFINKHVEDNWDLHDPDTGEFLLSGEVRAKYAADSFDKAQRGTYMSDLSGDKQRLYQSKKDALKGQEGHIAPEPREPGPTMVEAIAAQAVENPLYKAPFTFVTIPWNILKAAFDRAPGIAQFTHRNQADMLSSNSDAFHGAKGRKVMSAVVLGLAYQTATKGRFTGSGARDPRQRDVQTGAGYKKYTWTSENGIQYDMSRLEPFNIPFKIASNVKENLEFAENDPEAQLMIDQYASALIGAFAEALTDSTYAAGVMKLGLLFHDLSDEDDRNKALSKFVDQTMMSFTKVRAISQFGEAADDVVRIFSSEAGPLERQFRLTIFPYGAPPRRDPIFGYPIEKHPSYPNKFIQMLTPIERTEKFVMSPIYQELAALHAGANRIDPLIDGNVNLNSARAYTNLEVVLPPTGEITDRAELRLKRANSIERDLKFHAKTFTAPGGESCPIGQLQSYNDFEQQYISVRKVNWHKTLRLKEWKENIPPEWDVTTEGYKKLVKLFDTVRGDQRLDHEVNLETLLLALASSKEYKAFSKEPNKFTNELSYCRQILSAEIRAFRTDARKELWGEPIDIDESEKLDISYSGMVSTFWPELAYKRLFIKDQKLKSMGINPQDVNPVVQEQKERGAIKGILDEPNKKK